MSRLREFISLYYLILLVPRGEHDNSIDTSRIFLDFECAFYIHMKQQYEKNFISLQLILHYFFVTSISSFRKLLNMLYFWNNNTFKILFRNILNCWYYCNKLYCQTWKNFLSMNHATSVVNHVIVSQILTANVCFYIINIYENWKKSLYVLKSIFLLLFGIIWKY